MAEFYCNSFFVADTLLEFMFPFHSLGLVLDPLSIDLASSSSIMYEYEFGVVVYGFLSWTRL